MFDDDELIMISALQSYLFCRRQVALLHLENAWSDNLLTIQGSIMHNKVHSEKISKNTIKSKETGLSLRSVELGLIGKADCIEYGQDKAIYIIEYKRGRPKQHQADEVQLCAQCLCLEEMMGISINKGFIYYGENRKRFEVIFSLDLRNLTKTSIIELRTLLKNGQTPKAIYSKACDSCAQQHYCLPKVYQSAKKYLKSAISNM